MISVYSPVHLSINREKAIRAYIQYNQVMCIQPGNIADQVRAADAYFDALEDAIENEDEAQ